MEKKSIISAYKYNKVWNGPKGTVHYHFITLENGDTGSIGTKTQDAPKLQIGQELTYTIELNESGNKIKAVNPTFVPQQQNNNNGTPLDADRQLMIVRQSSLKMAHDYLISFGQIDHKKVSPKDVTEMADYFTNWVMGK